MTNYFIPTKQQVLDLQIGNVIPNCFGKASTITEITAKHQDINGKWFTCFTLAYGNSSTISGSLKEGELHRTAKLSGMWKSWELDEIESHLNGNGRISTGKLSDKLQAFLQEN